MSASVSKSTPHGTVELRGDVDAIAYAMGAMRSRDTLMLALERIASECERPESNGVRLSPSAMLTAIERYARAAVAKGA
jgi:hypothetical protein